MNGTGTRASLILRNHDFFQPSRSPPVLQNGFPAVPGSNGWSDGPHFPHYLQGAWRVCNGNGIRLCGRNSPGMGEKPQVHKDRKCPPPHRHPALRSGREPHGRAGPLTGCFAMRSTKETSICRSITPLKTKETIQGKTTGKCRVITFRKITNQLYRRRYGKRCRKSGNRENVTGISDRTAQ